MGGMASQHLYHLEEKKRCLFRFPPKKKAQLRSHRPLRSYHAHTLASGQQHFLPSGASKLTLQPSSTTFPTLKGWSWLPEQHKETNPASFLLLLLCVCVCFFFCFPIRIRFFESELPCKVCVDSIHISIILAWKQGSHPPSNDPCLHLVAPARPMASSNTCHQLVGRLHWGHPLQGSIQNHAAKTCSEKYGKTSKTTHPRMHHGHTAVFGAFRGSDWTYGNDTLGTSSCATTTTTDALKRQKIDDEPRPESGSC